MTLLFGIWPTFVMWQNLGALLSGEECSLTACGKRYEEKISSGNKQQYAHDVARIEIDNETASR
jgi:hypothetical protein